MGTKLVNFCRNLLMLFIEELQDYKFVKKAIRNRSNIPQDGPMAEDVSHNHGVLTLD